MKKSVIIALLMVVAAGFANAQERVIAKVNGETITNGDITQKLWWQHSAQALSDIIDERLLLEEAARLKVGYDKKEAKKRFDNLAAGYKDKNEFEKSLKAVGWTPAGVQDLIKRQMLSRNVVIAAKKIKFTKSDIKNVFEQNKNRLGKSDSVKVRQIYLATKNDADDVYQVLAAGADFAKLSAIKSVDENLRSREGDIGEVTRGLLQPELEKEIFSLKPGQYTRPIATGNGFSLFKVESYKAGEPAKLTKKLKADLRTRLENQAVKQKLPELIGELRQKAKIEVVR